MVEHNPHGKRASAAAPREEERMAEDQDHETDELVYVVARRPSVDFARAGDLGTVVSLRLWCLSCEDTYQTPGPQPCPCPVCGSGPAKVRRRWPLAEDGGVR
jgi:hypothetical protein